MATATESLEAVRAANTKADGLIEAFNALKQQLADVLAGVTLPPGVQADIDAIFAEANAQADETAAAIDENVPEEPPAP